jgi:hypothetical protein
VGKAVREHSERLTRSNDHGFASRLGSGASLSPALLRYPSPQDHCGFEALAPELDAGRSMGEGRDGTRVEKRRDRSTSDHDFDHLRLAGSESSPGALRPSLSEHRGDRFEPESTIAGSLTEPIRASSAPRLKQPGLPAAGAWASSTKRVNFG